jgi:hypothetical protein
MLAERSETRREHERGTRPPAAGLANSPAAGLANSPNPRGRRASPSWSQPGSNRRPPAYKAVPTITTSDDPRRRTPHKQRGFGRLEGPASDGCLSHRSDVWATTGPCSRMTNRETPEPQRPPFTVSPWRLHRSPRWSDLNCRGGLERAAGALALGERLHDRLARGSRLRSPLRPVDAGHFAGRARSDHLPAAGYGRRTPCWPRYSDGWFCPMEDLGPRFCDR